MNPYDFRWVTKNGTLKRWIPYYYYYTLKLTIFELDLVSGFPPDHKGL